MVVLTLLLRLIAEDPLINPNIAVVPQMRLDDVVQINTRRRPLRQNGSRERKHRSRRDDGSYRPEIANLPATLAFERVWAESISAVLEFLDVDSADVE